MAKVSDDEVRVITILLWMMYRSNVISRSVLKQMLDVLTRQEMPENVLGYLMDELKKDVPLRGGA